MFGVSAVVAQKLKMAGLAQMGLYILSIGSSLYGSCKGWNVYEWLFYPHV